jgi:hypothetical protein
LEIKLAAGRERYPEAFFDKETRKKPLAADAVRYGI